MPPEHHFLKIKNYILILGKVKKKKTLYSYSGDKVDSYVPAYVCPRIL